MIPSNNPFPKVWQVPYMIFEERVPIGNLIGGCFSLHMIHRACISPSNDTLKLDTSPPRYLPYESDQVFTMTPSSETEGSTQHEYSPLSTSIRLLNVQPGTGEVVCELLDVDLMYWSTKQCPEHEAKISRTKSFEFDPKSNIFSRFRRASSWLWKLSEKPGHHEFCGWLQLPLTRSK